MGPQLHGQGRRQVLAKALDTTELEAQQQEFLSEMEVLNGMIQPAFP